MARQFNGTTQAAQSTSALALSSFNTITIAWWMWWDTFANDDHIASELSANWDTSAGTWLIDPNYSATGKMLVGVSAGDSTNYAIKDFARISAAAWHHWAVTIDLTKNESDDSNRKIQNLYIDGSTVAGTSINASYTGTAGTFANSTLNIMARNATSLWAAGRIAEFGIWSSLLSGAAIADMASGGAGGIGKSAAFYPTGLLYYWKTLGTTSPEPENSAGIALTLVGSPTQVTHPSIAYPVSQRRGMFKGIESGIYVGVG